MKQQLALHDLRKFSSVDEVISIDPEASKNSNGLIGQHRAEQALKLGIGIRTPGFNIYAAGLAGTGKLSAVKKFVEAPASGMPVPDDWVYVNNFKDSFQPIRLSLPAGMGVQFRKAMKNLVQEAVHALARAFESEEYANRRKKITDAFEHQQEAAMEELAKMARRESFLLKQTPWEVIAIPLIDEQPVTDKQFHELPEYKQQEIKAMQDKVLDQIKAKLGTFRKQEKEVGNKLFDLEQEVAEVTIRSLIEDYAADYQQLPHVLVYFDEVKNDMLDNLEQFMQEYKRRGANGGETGAAGFLKRYDVNVLVDNTNLSGAPVIYEPNPTYTNLMGRAEKESYMGTLLTDFTMIRKGALHSANGGFLIIRVEELLQNYFSWHGLKNALKNKEILIEEPGDQLGLLTTKTLKPEPVPLNVKVILVGHPVYYYLLYNYEPDFKSLFKIKADFDSEMERNEKNVHDFVSFVRSVCDKEQLLLPDNGAMAKVVEYGSRLVADQQKLSTRFSVITDIVHEANHYARAENASSLTVAHISRAIEEKEYRSDLLQEKIDEMIVANQICIDIDGEQIGQVNGLSVLDLGDISFGRPSRITCSLGIGREGIVAIEREAELSGPIHTKGVMILTGYLSEQYIQEKPASLSARLVFEQSYAGVEGDSASSAELYALLSSLAQLPVRQGIAVTGSVNQKGQIQAVGGANEKIEGYFEVCKKMGLTGRQGVMIPATNVRNLMLKEEVLEAVEQKQFAIWAVDTVEDGIEILTGVKAGPVTEEGTVAFRVSQALNTYADRMQSFGNGVEGNGSAAET